MRDIAELKFPCPVCGNEMKFNVPASDVRSVHITNADRLRSMTDEELAEWIMSLIDDVADYYNCEKHTPDLPIEKHTWLDWLRQEADNA